MSSGTQPPDGLQSDKCARLRAFVLRYLDNLSSDGGGGAAPDLPEFELYSHGYLGFAEAELGAFLSNAKGSRNLINCISHLKRAMDCQLDTFLHVFNISKIFRDRNLKFEKKLDFLTAAGVISARSLKRLNTIRNRMEHDFAVPKVGDIELYFDLVVAFVGVLQGAISSVQFSERYFTIEEPDHGRLGVFEIKYVLDAPAVVATWHVQGDQQELRSSIEESIEEFAFFLRVLFLLGILDSFASTRYIALKLSSEESREAK